DRAARPRRVRGLCGGFPGAGPARNGSVRVIARGARRVSEGMSQSLAYASGSASNDRIFAASHPLSEYHNQVRFPTVWQPDTRGGCTMRRIVAGVVVVLLAGPVLADDDKPKDKSK